MHPGGSLLPLPIAHCTATNSYTSYFRITHTAAALPGQRDMTPNCPRHRYYSLKEKWGDRQGKSLFDEQRVTVFGVESELEQAVTALDKHTAFCHWNNTSLTTFHRSLTRESTLRMSACSTPPLIPSVDQGCCPHCLPSTSCLRLSWAFGPCWRTLEKSKRDTTMLETDQRMSWILNLLFVLLWMLYNGTPQCSKYKRPDLLKLHMKVWRSLRGKTKLNPWLDDSYSNLLILDHCCSCHTCCQQLSSRQTHHTDL